MKRLILGMLWVMTLVPAAAGPVAVSVSNPRPFGHVIGDVVERDVHLSVPAPYQLDRNSLPKRGRLSAWLELREVSVREHGNSQQRRYDVLLRYQIFNSLQDVKTLDLPSYKLLFNGSAPVVETQIPEWPITVAPITPETVLARDGLEEARPDLPPALIKTSGYRTRISTYAAALAALLGYVAYRRVLLPRFARGPFARAYRDLRRHSTPAPDASAFRTALRRVHRAFDEAAGRTVVAENLDAFLNERRQPAGLREQTREFFEVSRNEFFGAGAMQAAPSLDRLLSLCLAWRELEHGG